MQKYFDKAATTLISEKALEAYNHTVLNYFGNPSANYSLGSKANDKLEESREKIASLLKVNPNFIYFTSGGTEANSIILSSLLWSKNPGEVIISKTEHSSILNFEKILIEKGFKVITLNAPGGFLSSEILKANLTNKTRMVFTQAVNNVTGAINDLNSLVQVVREKEKEIGRKIYFHTDAVQALTKIDFDLTSLDVDSASFAAHKFHGPRGIGFLYCKTNNVQSLSRGGGQEKGIRPGTENLGAIVAMTVALEESLKKNNENVLKINKYVRENLKPTILSPTQNCSPFIINFSIDSFPSEVFTRMLDDEGFVVSAGSACSNNVKVKGQNVLIAMNIKPEIAKSSIRISFNKDTELKDAKLLVKKINSLYDTLVR